MIKVRLFAALRELADSSEVEVDAADVAGVLQSLEARLGGRFAQIMAAGTVVVNGEPAGRDRSLEESDEVALLPPVSGG